MSRYEEFIRRLVSGCTCKRFVNFIVEYRGYLIYHHKSHPEYINQWSGTVTCEAYYSYIKFDPEFKILWTDFFLSAKHVQRRKSKKTIEYVKSLIDADIAQGE